MLTNVDDLFICRKKPYFELRELWKPRELREPREPMEPRQSREARESRKPREPWEPRELSFEILPCNIGPNS